MRCPGSICFSFTAQILVIIHQTWSKNDNADCENLHKTLREVHFDAGALGSKTGFTSLEMYRDHHVV